jgi:tripartite-type tricarboxylate transporter receptor subunit TctC
MKLQSILAAGLALLVAPAWAQTVKFPESGKTIRMIVPFAAGGGVDNAARLLGEQLRKQLGVTVIVDNRAGANGTLGGKAVQTAPADGYTLLFSAATHVLAKQVMSNAPYDPQADFAPVARVGEAPLMLVIAPQKEQHKLADVLAAVKQQPGKWTAAIPAAGAPSHLATLLLAKQANVTLTYVPYKGTQPALVDVGGGHVDLLMDSMISVLPLAKSARVKPIAITSAKRSTLAPEVPTVAESGLPNFSYASWYGVWAPKDTPADRIAILNTTINAAVSEIGKSGAFAKLGIEPVTESTEQFKRFVANDVAQSAELLKSAGFKPE